MIRLWPGFWSFLALASIVTFSSRAALAASHDAEAIKLREAAIYQDYLATDFPSAEKKLTQALTLCEKPADCTPTTRARLHCDLGVVFFASQKAADGRAQFAAALQEDPNVALDPDLTSPDLQKEFAAIKSGAAPPAAGQAAGGQPPSGQGAGAPSPPPVAEEKDAGAEGTPPAENEGETTPAPKSTPKATASSSDCPPGFPGCKSETTCSNDDDCGAGEKCVNEVCRGEKEEEQGASGKANWVSLAYQVDIPLLPAKSNVCLGGQGYSCFYPNGSWYSATPVAGGGGQIQSAGLQVGTMRVLAGFDRVFADNFTLGGALGFAFGGGPTRNGGSPFFPVQIEARGKYWFGRRPMGRSGFRFYLMLNGGMAEVAASIKTFVYEADTGNTPQQRVAWYHMGRGFAGGGLGAMYAITPNMGVVLELRAAELFPTVGTSFAGQVAYAIGF